MKTAKDLAFESYCEGLMEGMISKFKDLSPEDQSKAGIRFENWWSTRYWNNDPYKDHFKPDHIITLDGKVYIKAE